MTGFEINVRVSWQAIIQTLHLLSAKTLMDLPEILLYKC